MGTSSYDRSVAIIVGQICIRYKYKIEKNRPTWIDASVSTNDKIRRLFAQYDADGTGTLDAHEVKRVCAAMGQSMDATGMDAMMKVEFW